VPQVLEAGAEERVDAFVLGLPRESRPDPASRNLPQCVDDETLPHVKARCFTDDSDSRPRWNSVA